MAIPFVPTTLGAGSRATADAGGRNRSSRNRRPEQPVVVTTHRDGDLLLTLAASHDGKVLASAGFDGVVHLWDVVNSREIRKLEGEQATIRSVTFSPDGKTVACVNDEGHVRAVAGPRDRDVEAELPRPGRAGALGRPEDQGRRGSTSPVP